MPSLPLLSRPERESDRRLAKWPFLLAGAVFVGLIVLGNFWMDRAIPEEGGISKRSTTEPLEVSLDIPVTAASAYPSEWAVYFDPTLMVLPNDRSFSKAYLHKAPQRPAPHEDLSVASMPYEFKRPYFRAGAVSPTIAGSWGKQDPNLLVAATPVPAADTASFSTLGVYGELQNRTILSAPVFPRVAQTELLVPTELTIGVDAAGAVRMVLVSRSSGSEATDELGLKLARQVSFAPVPNQGDRMSWGQLKIFWAVELRPAAL
jgi:hypothetical protein